MAIDIWDSDVRSEYVVQIYSYNQELNTIVPIQYPISAGDIYSMSMDLSNDFLVYWDYNERDAFIYHQEEENQTFTFLQQLNITGPRNNYGLAIDNDILVIRGNGITHIFSEQNDGQ